MSSVKHSSSASILDIAPTLRSDLKFSLQRHADEVCYLIEDELNAKFYRIGIPEYTFISLLDGTTTIQEALALTAGKLGPDAFSENDAAAICQWLINSQLAETEASRETSRLSDRATEHQRGASRQRLNPFMIRLPLLHPDGWISACTKLCGWAFSWFGFGLWTIVAGYAVFRLLTHGDHSRAATYQVFSANNLLWFALTWGILKFVHEISHAVACKYFGGYVREAGIMIMVFAPVPYVDVTSSWRFESKWHRIIVALAGMYAELFCASVAAVVWCSHGSPVVKQVAYNFMFSASVMTVLFNANPLMRFDGYYILADWLEIPNLAGLGQQYLQFLGKTLVLGVPAKLPVWGTYRGIIVRSYGILSCIWRLMVSVTLLLTISVLWHGIGLAFTILAAVLWFGIPLGKFLHYLVKGSELERPNILRFALVATTLAGMAVAIGILPEPGGIDLDGIVAYKDQEIVRAPFDGFVRAVHVNAGQNVQSGELLMELENREIEVDSTQLASSIQMCDVRARKYQEAGDLGAMQAEYAAKESLVRKEIDQRTRLEKRKIKTQDAGEIIGSSPHDLIGTFVKEGAELVSLGDPNSKEIHFLVDQGDAPLLRTRLGHTVQIHRKWRKPTTMTCDLHSVDPAATVEPTEKALLSTFGGNLPVRELATGDAEATRKLHLIEPYFPGVATLTREQSQTFFVGERVVVSVRVSRGSIATWGYRSLKKWVDGRLK